MIALMVLDAALQSLLSSSSVSGEVTSWLSLANSQFIGPRKHFWSSARHALTGQKVPLICCLWLADFD